MLLLSLLRALCSSCFRASTMDRTANRTRDRPRRVWDCFSGTQHRDRGFCGGKEDGDGQRATGRGCLDQGDDGRRECYTGIMGGYPSVAVRCVFGVSWSRFRCKVATSFFCTFRQFASDSNLSLSSYGIFLFSGLRKCSPDPL